MECPDRGFSAVRNAAKAVPLCSTGPCNAIEHSDALEDYSCDYRLHCYSPSAMMTFTVRRMARPLFLSTQKFSQVFLARG